jgi:hypothetical protein
MVHWGRELLSEAGYFHSVSMLDDPLRIRRACDRAGYQALRPVRAHPAVQAGDQRRIPQAGDPLRRRMRRPGDQHRRRPETGWTTEAEDHVLMRYTLRRRRRRRGPRASSSASNRTSSTANTRPASTGSTRWSKSPRHRHQLRHRQQLPLRPRSLRLARTRPRPPRPPPRQGHLRRQSGQRARQGHRHAVGCACGDGVIDWAKSDREICRRAPRDIVFSVECGTLPSLVAASVLGRAGSTPPNSRILVAASAPARRDAGSWATSCRNRTAAWWPCAT